MKERLIILVFFMLLSMGCDHEEKTYCIHCRNEAVASVTYCGVTLEEMNQIIDYWQHSCIDTLSNWTCEIVEPQ